MPNSTKKDRDEITVAKTIFDEIVEFSEHEETPKEKRAKLGGKARSEKLTPEQRSSSAKSGGFRARVALFGHGIQQISSNSTSSL